MARRRFQKGQIIFSQSRQVWLGRYREDVIRGGKTIRTRPQVVLGTKRELPTQRLAARKLDEILSRINASTYQPTRTATVTEFAERWRREVLAKRKPSTVRAAKSHLDHHILPQLGKLRLDQVGPENQQIFINQLVGASRKTVLNVLSTLSSMITTAKAWGYSARDVERRKKLVLPERNTHVAAHFTRSQVESIFTLAADPWRTFFALLAMTGMRAGEALGLQWGDIDFEHSCIHIRRSAWQGKVQSTKTKGSAAPITLPLKLAGVLKEFQGQWSPNPEGFLFVTRNGRPPSSNKVVEYQLWPILDALSIPRCGLHAFRHTVASLIVDAGYSPEVARRQLRQSDTKTTLGYIHLRGDATEQAMSAVADSLKLDAVGRGAKGCNQYIQ